MGFLRSMASHPLATLTLIRENAAYDDAEGRRLVLLQLINALAIAAMLLFAFLYALVGWRSLYAPALLSLACIPLYALSIVLNRNGFPQTAKLLFASTLTGSVFISTLLFLGRAPGMHFYFLLAAVVPLFIWSLKRPFWILAFMAASLAGFCFIQFRADESLILVRDFPSAWLGFFRAFSIVQVYAVTVFILALFQRRAEADAKRLNDKARVMEDLMRKYEELSNTDALTSLYNRRAMLLRMQEERIRMNRNHTSFAIVLCDIDFFKAINDQYGHEAGDAVLMELGAILRGSIREVDHLARWGGEEFLILLPDTFSEGALVVAEKIRQKIEANAFCWNGAELHCTMTLGIAMHDLTHIDLNETIRQADAALYKGKRSGRNQVVFMRDGELPIDQA